MTTNVVEVPAGPDQASVGESAVPVEPDIPETAFRDAIPRLPRGQEIFTRAFAAVAWLYGLYWII